MSETTPKFATTFRLSEDDYLQYNFDVAATTMRKNRRRQTFIGILWIVISIALFASSFFTDAPTAWYMYLINIVIFLFGVYSLIYYRVFFAGNLKKAVAKAYPKSEYLTNDITVEFFDDHFREAGANRDNTFEYKDIDGVQVDRRFILLLCDKEKVVLIPVAQLPEGMYDELFKFLRQVCLGEMKLFIDKEAVLPEGLEKTIDWGETAMEDYDDTPPPLDENDPDLDRGETDPDDYDDTPPPLDENDPDIDRDTD